MFKASLLLIPLPWNEDILMFTGNWILFISPAPIGEHTIAAFGKRAKKATHLPVLGNCILGVAPEWDRNLRSRFLKSI